MTELAVLLDLFKNSDRQGPGSKEETLKALGFMDLPRNRQVKIADLGCGSGGQTLTLAQKITGHLTAVDLFPEFLEELRGKSERLGVQEKIKTLQGSMEDLPFSKGAFDVIWSEGAIYNMGFENGVKKWKDYLTIGGYLAVSEITWITHIRPKEIEDFWQQEYPEIDTASNKIKILEDNGYTLVGYFYLAQNSWLENYYKPMEARFEPFLERNHHSAVAKNIVQEHQNGVSLWGASMYIPLSCPL